MYVHTVKLFLEHVLISDTACIML